MNRDGRKRLWEREAGASRGAHTCQKYEVGGKPACSLREGGFILSSVPLLQWWQSSVFLEESARASHTTSWPSHCFSSRETTVTSAMISSYQRSENCASFTSPGFVPKLRTAPTCMISFGAQICSDSGAELSLLVVAADLHSAFSHSASAVSSFQCIWISFNPHICPMMGLLFLFCRWVNWGTR